jgi:hypothetical protein
METKLEGFHWKRLTQPIAIPAWLIIGGELFHIVHIFDFIAEHLSWLTTPMGNLFVIVFALTWLFAIALWPTTLASGTRAPQTDDIKQVWFFPAGLSVSLRRGAETQTVLIYLHILSTKPTELIYIRLDLTDTTGLRIVCEHAEPMVVNRFETTAKMIEQKITAQELSKFQKGMPVNLDGYAKFRDGNTITQERITLSTIPNV